MKGNVHVLEKSVLGDKPVGVCARCGMFYTCRYEYKHIQLNRMTGEARNFDPWFMQRLEKKLAAQAARRKEEERLNGQREERKE